MIDYWKRTVGHINVGRYHLEKPGHSLLIGALLSFWFPPLIAVALAVVGYLLIGKLIVRSHPSKDWIADLVIGSLAIVAVLAFTESPWSWVAFLVWCGLYTWLVLDWRWASP